MMRTKGTVAATVLTVLALAAPTAATAAVDTTPPALSLPGNAYFAPGSVIGPMALDAGEMSATDSISMRAKWTATDASGVCGSASEA